MDDQQPPRVWDYRRDIANLVVTPEIRARFLRMEPGEVGPYHSHDVGSEVFIVLEGEAEFLIRGHRLLVGPGQMCVAFPGELHEVRTVGDQPMTLYLSVTPHLEPTHTYPVQDGADEPRVATWSAAGLADWKPRAGADANLAIAYRARLATAIASMQQHLEDLDVEISRASTATAGIAVDPLILWPSLRSSFEAMSKATDDWNRLTYSAYRTKESEALGYEVN